MQTLHAQGLLVALAAVAGIALLAAPPKSPTPVTEDPILTVYPGSLEVVQLAAATDKQDVLPIVAQRGTRIDGSLRSRPMQRMAIRGNPYENAWTAGDLNGIRLETGTYAISDVDLALPAKGFPWVVGRSFNNRQDVSGAHVSNGPQGRNWFQASMPEISLYEAANDEDDVLYLFYGADAFVEYRRASSSARTFRGRNGAAGVWEFTEDAMGPDTYTLMDQNGNELVFFGFDSASAPAKGQLWTITDPADNTAYVGHATNTASALSSGYTADGFIKEAYDTSGRRYTYTYADDAGSTKRLTQVKAELDDSGWVEVGRVDYEYYGSESHGSTGDLKLVEITTPLTDSGVNSTAKKYYRYWEDSDAEGDDHDIKMIVGFEGTRAYDWAGDSTFDEDFLTADDSVLKPYAESYFEYSSHQISVAIFNGDCGCGDGSEGTYNISYSTNGSHPAQADVYDEEWYSRAVVLRPDGTYLIQYFDEIGQPLSRVITDGLPTGSPDRWVTRVERDSSGRVTTISTPASVTGYTHSTGAITVSTTSGLIWTYSREGSNSRHGFVSGKSWKEGSSGASVKVEEYEYENLSFGVNTNESYVYRPVLRKVHRYPDEASQTQNDRETTDGDPSEASAPLAIDYVTTTNPTVSTGNNGSGSATDTTQYLRDDGTPSFHVDEDDVVTYREYTDGQLTELIEDADDGQGGDFDETIPVTTSSDAVHRKTTYTYDAQGRADTVTQPDGRVIKYYYSKLADGRLVTLRYNDFDAGSPSTYYGPVQYTVANQAGKTEAQATVALTGNSATTALTGHVDETDSDPILAMDLGTVARLTTNLYDDAGTTLEESRLYFDIPASGAGIDGTNYDGTFFAYDDMGRRWRVKEPSGTIRRTVYDDMGRVSERWLGTNDFSFSEGESAGPDDMVKTESMEYDGNADDGNGYLTKRTLFVQDSATDSRVTTYTNDARGRALLETRPTVPHALHKYDNYGRRVATGLYKGTGNITVGTTDPTSSGGASDGSDDRLALTQTFYDERGQVWKTMRHNIDALDGSDDDDLETLHWYDGTGQRIKTDGPQLTKTAYDRLGRQTHQYVLAGALTGSSPESGYTAATTLTDDIVLEEHQTVYESSDSDDVVMRVSIAREHDDLLNGTTGALDSNADTDDLKVTAANVSGRAQITALWYDDLGRVTDTVRYGTNGGGDFTRTSLTVPSRSDDELLTENSYNDDGTVQDVTDPRGLVTRTEYDDAGRTTATIRNYVNGIPSGTTGDDDVYTRYAYTDGLRTKIWVDFDGDGTEDTGDQVTRYIYGTTNATPSASEISTGHLLRATVYPDSTNTGTTEENINSNSGDVVSYAYNAQGQEVYKKDQAGNVLEGVYDDSGRRTQVKATAVATGFDDAVERLQWAYTDLGQVETLTSYDDPSAGSAVNEVDYTYDGWGNVTSFKQDKDGTVGASGYYEVAYTWAKATGGRNTIKKTGATLPSGASLTYRYLSSANRLDNATSRVTEILHGATAVARYDYNGLAQVISTDYRQPDVKWDLSQGGGGTYPDLDRFNRVTDSRWTAYSGTATDFFDLHITYDRNSNISRVEDNVHVGFDWSYEMDGLDRLYRAERGTWSGSSIDSLTQQEDQTWTLDKVGNWDQVTLDLNADNVYTGTDEYDDDRTHNDVNELTGRDTDDNGTDDYTLSYDPVGNLADDGESYEYVYDPFGRLRKINDQSSNLVAEYKYNGLGHMIAVHEDTDTDGDVDGDDSWFHPVHDERWRMLANFRETDSDPKEEWVNEDAGLDGRGGSSYINGVILRDRDENTAWTSASDGTLEERIYLCQNWRGDVSALVYADGCQVEQVRYSPYGKPFGLPGGDCDSDGDCDHGDTADSDQIQGWIDASAYDVRGDLDLDGDVDTADKSRVTSGYGGTSLAQLVLGDSGNVRGYSGYWVSVSTQIWKARYRYLHSQLGRWASRDPLEYIDGESLIAYNGGAPIGSSDPFGLCEGCSILAVPISGGGAATAGGCSVELGAQKTNQEHGECSPVPAFPFAPFAVCRGVKPCSAEIKYTATPSGGGCESVVLLYGTDKLISGGVVGLIPGSVESYDASITGPCSGEAVQGAPFCIYVWDGVGNWQTVCVTVSIICDRCLGPIILLN